MGLVFKEGMNDNGFASMDGFEATKGRETSGCNWVILSYLRPSLDLLIVSCWFLYLFECKIERRLLSYPCTQI